MHDEKRRRAQRPYDNKSHALTVIHNHQHTAASEGRNGGRNAKRSGSRRRRGRWLLETDEVRRTACCYLRVQEVDSKDLRWGDEGDDRAGMAALGSSRGIRRALTLSLGLSSYNNRMIRGYRFYILGHVYNARPGD